MSTVTLADAKAHLSHLIDQVAAVASRLPVLLRWESPNNLSSSAPSFVVVIPHWRKASMELLREERD